MRTTQVTNQTMVTPQQRSHSTTKVFVTMLKMLLEKLVPKGSQWEQEVVEEMRELQLSDKSTSLRMRYPHALRNTKEYTTKINGMS